MMLSGLTGSTDAADDPDEAKAGKEAARPRRGRRRSPLHPLASPLRAVDLTFPPLAPPLFLFLLRRFRPHLRFFVA